MPDSQSACKEKSWFIVLEVQDPLALLLWAKQNFMARVHSGAKPLTSDPGNKRERGRNLGPHNPLGERASNDLKTSYLTLPLLLNAATQ
jgi:hypothetical protein